MSSLPIDMHFLVESFASTTAPQSAIYCSAPITSGRRHNDWLRRIGEIFESIDEVSEDQRLTHAREVISANCSHARGVVATLRADNCAVVIDPTAYPAVSGWTQDEWLAFWGAVIKRYASRVVFLDDWQFSAGCTREFMIATESGIPRYDERGEPLAINEALELIKRAIADTAAANAPVARLSQNYERLLGYSEHQ